ncbi:TraR/DksA C4-type zinc finger protein [Pseudomonas fulva]|uniref:TraR/DksA C4-type zinc finger protein n=1 Tax=Pseudomonas fulva TaxID=47880 RepID=UPI00201DB482|nr:TraR/DksA C4-type zinc finger protein [Pseudomonas fulva]UQY33802.1 TraR/DksA C4-type zinc finger protein [Pseudomonas fulva]
MDEHQFELAQKAEEARVAQAIANRVQYQGESAEECESCGTDIPLARRLAVPGCQTCVDCQSLRERRG